MKTFTLIGAVMTCLATSGCLDTYYSTEASDGGPSAQRDGAESSRQNDDGALDDGALDGGGAPAQDPIDNVPVDCVATSCRYVTPSGAGAMDGSDWSHAYAGLPSTLARGTTYFVASGTYARYHVDTPTSGSERITIKKASDADHGSDVGWSAAYGSQGQAVFTGGMTVTDSGYVTIDGTYEYGFSFVVADGSAGFVVDGMLAVQRVGITLRYTDIAGTHGDVPHNFTSDTRAIYIFPYIGNNSFANVRDLVVQHCNLHAVSTLIQFDQKGGATNNFIVEYTKLHDNIEAAGYNPATMAHQNLAFLANIHGVIFRYNEAWSLTAVGIYPCYTGSGLEIYGNLFHDFRGYPIFIYDPGTYSGGKIYNNTFENDAGGTIWDGGNRMVGGDAKNNRFSNSATPTWGGFAHAFDSFDGAWKDVGTSLDAIYGRDARGNERGADGAWDIGAFEETP